MSLRRSMFLALVGMAGCGDPLETTTETQAGAYRTGASNLCGRPAVSADGAKLAAVRCADANAKAKGEIRIYDLTVSPQTSSTVAAYGTDERVGQVTVDGDRVGYVTTRPGIQADTLAWRAHVVDLVTKKERVSAEQITTSWPSAPRLLGSGVEHVLVEASGWYDVPLSTASSPVRLGTGGASQVEVAREGDRALSFGTEVIQRVRFPDAMEAGPTHALPRTRTVVPSSYVGGSALLQTRADCVVAISGMASACNNEPAAAIFVFDPETGSSRVLASGHEVRFIAEGAKGVLYVTKNATGLYALERITRSGQNREVLYKTKNPLGTVVLDDNHESAFMLEGKTLLFVPFDGKSPEVISADKIEEIRAAGPNVFVTRNPSAAEAAKDPYGRYFSLVDRASRKAGAWIAWKGLAIAASMDGGRVFAWDSQAKMLRAWDGKRWQQLEGIWLRRFDELVALPRGGVLVTSHDQNYVYELALHDVP